MMRAALLMLVACGHAPLIVSPDEDVAELTERGVSTINFAAGEQLVTIGDHGTRVRRGEVPGACGMHHGTEIVVSRCSEVVDLSHVVFVHEVGHALGLQHSRYRGPIMAAQLQQLDWEEASRSLVSALP